MEGPGFRPCAPISWTLPGALFALSQGLSSSLAVTGPWAGSGSSSEPAPSVPASFVWQAPASSAGSVSLRSCVFCTAGACVFCWLWVVFGACGLLHGRRLRLLLALGSLRSLGLLHGRRLRLLLAYRLACRGRLGDLCLATACRLVFRRSGLLLRLLFHISSRSFGHRFYRGCLLAGRLHL